MVRSWSVRDFFLIWLGGLFGTGVLFAASTLFADPDLRLVLALAGQYLGNLGVFWLLSRSKEDRDIGFVIQGGDFGYAALGLILQIAIALLILPVSNLLFPDGRPPQEVADIIANADSTLLKVGLIVAAVVLAPVTEEIIFRGVLLKALRPRSDRFAIVVTAAAFAAVHVIGLDVERLWQSAVVVLPPLFLLGVLLAWVTVRSGRLGPAIFLHSGWNLLAAFVLLLPADLVEQVG